MDVPSELIRLGDSLDYIGHIPAASKGLPMDNPTLPYKGKPIGHPFEALGLERPFPLGRAGEGHGQQSLFVQFVPDHFAKNWGGFSSPDPRVVAMSPSICSGSETGT